MSGPHNYPSDAAPDSLARKVAVRQQDDRDCWVRLFNRLEAAVTHHRRDQEGPLQSDADERLWAARDRILRDAGRREESAPELREELARMLYVASGGDERVFPWPPQSAPRYRRLADVALVVLGG